MANPEANRLLVLVPHGMPHGTVTEFDWHVWHHSMEDSGMKRADVTDTCVLIDVSETSTGPSERTQRQKLEFL